MTQRVLIVEDSPVMRQLLSMAIESRDDLDLSIDEAPDGVAALKAIRSTESPYDLIFLDLNLPIMDGVKLLGFLQNEPGASRTVVCVVTTEGDDETERQVRALGARYYLRKPVTKRDVLAVVREVLGDR